MSPGYSYLGYVNSNDEYIGLAYGNIRIGIYMFLLIKLIG